MILLEAPAKNAVGIFLRLHKGALGWCCELVPPVAMSKYTNKPLFNLALLVAVLLVACAILKVTDLIYGRFKANTAVPDAKRAIRLKEHPPNISLIVQATPEYLRKTEGLPAGSYAFATDIDGFIKPGAWPKAVGEAEIIAFLGGSTTECLYIRESQRFPALVASELEITLKKRVFAINAGVSGNTGLHSLVNYASKIAKYEPDLVFVMHNINDLIFLMYTGSYWSEHPTKGIITECKAGAGIFRALPTAIKNALCPNLYPVLAGTLVKLNIMRPPDEYAGFRGRQVTAQEVMRMRVMFKKCLLANVRTIQSFGQTPVLMTQFNRISKQDAFTRRYFERETGGLPASYEAFVEYCQSFNEAIREVASEAEVWLLDLAAIVPGTKEHMYDPVHLNEKGCQLVAREIVSFIAAHQLLK